MKKLYTLILIAITSFGANAQNYTLNPGPVVNEVIMVNSYSAGTIYMDHNNVTADSIRLLWEMFESQTNPDWDYSYCDYTNCYTGAITSGTMVKFGNNQSGFIKVNLMSPTPGTGYFKFKVWEYGDEANADTVTINFDVTLGLSDQDLGADLNVFPNPVTDQELNISNILPGSKITIQNALGQNIESTQTNQSSIVFDNLDLRRGVYFVRLERNNSVYATRKVIVK